MTGWLLESLEIEGFRGINNEGDPLILKFASNAVNSISAPNGVGKSSIFDALTFALRGSIQKLDDLPAVERGADYYLNRFHSKSIGTVTLTVSQENGGASVRITVTRDVNGARTVTGPVGIDAETLLASLDRDFVLLDHKTLQAFIDDKALDRGRAFAGLLGLARYSVLRQELKGLANTRSYNNHVDTSALNQRRSSTLTLVNRYQAVAKSAFLALTQQELADQSDLEAAAACCINALQQISVLKPHCTNKRFEDIVIDDCMTAIRLAEGGDDRLLLDTLLREQSKWEELIVSGPTDSDKDDLMILSIASDEALAATSGNLLHNLYVVSQEVLNSDTWPDKTLCPTCSHQADHSILNEVQIKLAHYDSVENARKMIISEWSTKNWRQLIALESAARIDAEALQFDEANRRLSTHAVTSAELTSLWTWRGELLKRSQDKLDKIKAERLMLEQRLPPSLVAVTTVVDAARRLQDSWRELAKEKLELASITAQQGHIARVKDFLDNSSNCFAMAEANASTRRLSAVEPVCQSLFSAIMHQPVKPILVKPDGGEELSLGLAEFWSLQDVSAQALLSESFRNAFAVSVYLAAASLYGGAPLFMVLDDVTSSFDAGHQFHLMEVIRTRFARPVKVNGPQVILLSHDTLLEKLFNKNANEQGWIHQRLEGTARTAVLPQSNAVNRVRDATVNFLNAGQVDDAAPRLRQYLEYKLLEIISRVKIPVPVDFALDDHKKQVQASIDAIDSAVKLYQAAGSLVLTTSQVASLQVNIASIMGNFLAHFATGSTQAFSAPSLLGVMAAIDAYADCFMFENPPGSGHKSYIKNLSRHI